MRPRTAGAADEAGAAGTGRQAHPLPESLRAGTLARQAAQQDPGELILAIQQLVQRLAQIGVGDPQRLCLGGLSGADWASA